MYSLPFLNVITLTTLQHTISVSIRIENVFSAPQSVLKASTGQAVEGLAVTTVMVQVTSVISGLDVVTRAVSRDSSPQRVMMVRLISAVNNTSLLLRSVHQHVPLVLTEVIP